MASSCTPALRRARTTVLVLTAACGVTLAPLPAAAEPEQPTTSQQAAELVAARAHDLEVLTEQFNEARERLTATQESAARAAEELTAARAALTEAREHVRALARGAWTGDRLGALEAMLTSRSAAELLDRVGTLQTIAEHNNGVLGGAEVATDEADQAKAAAEQLATEAQAQVDRVAGQKDALDAQIAVYQAEYDRLNDEEQRASRAAAERHAQEQAAAAEQQRADPVEQFGGGPTRQHRLERAEPVAGPGAASERPDVLARLGQGGLGSGQLRGRAGR